MLRFALCSTCVFTPSSLILVVLTAESWGLLIGGVCMEPKTAQVGGQAVVAFTYWQTVVPYHCKACREFVNM